MEYVVLFPEDRAAVKVAMKITKAAVVIYVKRKFAMSRRIMLTGSASAWEAAIYASPSTRVAGIMFVENGDKRGSSE